MLKGTAAALVALLSLTGCDGGGIRLGDALEIPGRAGLRARNLRPGMEFVNMLATFTNTSERTVTLEKIVPQSTRGLGETAELVRTEIASTEGRLPSLASDYGTYPPVGRRDNQCIVHPVHAVAGYVMQPDEKVRILVQIRTIAPGAFRIGGEKVIYGRDGDTYQQVVPFVISGIIRDGAKRQELFPSEARCLEDTEILPGWEIPREAGSNR